MVLPPKPAIDPSLNMPPDVAAFVTRSCADCHGGQANTPWYGKVPPLSWMIQHDMEQAHRAVDFGDWATHNGRTVGSAIGTLSAACIDLQSGRMPLEKYLWLHPEARPSKAEVEMFCGWTRTEIARLAASRRTAKH